MGVNDGVGAVGHGVSSALVWDLSFLHCNDVLGAGRIRRGHPVLECLYLPLFSMNLGILQPAPGARG